MHKYTLKFKNNELELEYQVQRVQNIVSSFTMICVVTTINCLIMGIDQLRNGKYISATYNIIVILLYPGFYVFLCKYRKHWIETFLLFINHLTMLAQINLAGMTDQEIYIFGANMLTTHLICVQIMDLKGALLQLFTLLVIRLLIGSQFSQLSLATYILSFGSVIILAYVTFLSKKAMRNSFLQNKKERQWDLLLPHIIKHEFFLFQYNKQQVRFEVNIGSHNFKIQNESQERLTSFLRTHTIQGINLENLILQRCKLESAQQINTEYKIRNADQSELYIQYSEYYLTDLQFLIIVDRDRSTIEQLASQNSFYKTEKITLHQSMANLLTQILKLMKSKQSALIRCKLMQGISVFTYGKMKALTNYNVMRRLQTLAELFQKAYNIEINISNVSCELVTCAHIFDKMWVNILTICSIKQEITVIEIEQKYIRKISYIQFKISGNYITQVYDELSKNQIMIKCIEQLGPSRCIVFHQTYISFQVFQNMMDVSFNPFT